MQSLKLPMDAGTKSLEGLNSDYITSDSQKTSTVPHNMNIVMAELMVKKIFIDSYPIACTPYCLKNPE